MRILLLIGLCACVQPVVRGEHAYTVTRSHYSLETLPDGMMAWPGWSLSTPGNRPGEPDFGFRHGYGTTDYFIVNGIALRGDEAGLPLAELAKRWRDDLALFGLHYAHVTIPGQATVSELNEPQSVPGVRGSSIELKLRYTWSLYSYDVYAAILRDPVRDRVVVVMCGHDTGASPSSLAWSRDLARRVHFAP